MSSNQYIPVGVPASQNPYPSIPYSRNFPDEPESETSQLQTPLRNNDQQYNPPQHFAGQRPPMNQPGHFYPPAQGYNQPPQYIMAGNLMPVDPEKKRLETRVKDLEERLNSGWNFVYKIWLWINIVTSALFGVQVLFLGIIALCTGEMMMFVIMFPLGVICVWLFQQCFVMKNAMNDKNLEGAKRAFKSMVWFVASLSVLLVSVIALMGMHLGSPPPEAQDALSRSIATFAVQMFFQLFGAKQVIKLLEDREKTIGEMNSQFGAVANMA